MRSVGEGFELILVAILAGIATDVIHGAICCGFVKRLPLSLFQLYFFILDLLDLGPHPLFDSGFQFCLITSNQVLNGFASIIQSNEVTRDLIGLVLVGNEINQLTVIT